MSKNLAWQEQAVSQRPLTGLGRRTLIMGILNITPDSFSDGGHYLHVDDAIQCAMQMVEMGADIIDVGAESTRPGHTSLMADEEWSRLEPILAPLRDAVDVPISVDTYKADIAAKALDLGVDIVNDVWGGLRDPDILQVAAAHRAPIVLMHNSSERPHIVGDIVSIVHDELLWRVDKALSAGINEAQIILDPGVGFGKTFAQNLELINHVDRLKVTGFPVLVGTSRKSVIGHILGLPVNERVEGTAATVSVAIARGADIVRVHDVQEMARVAKMTDALVR